MIDLDILVKYYPSINAVILKILMKAMTVTFAILQMGL